MYTIEVNCPAQSNIEYTIYFANKYLDWIANDLVRKNYGSKYIIISDHNTAKLYAIQFRDKLLNLGKQTDLIQVSPGENSKSLKNFECLLKDLKNLQVRRGDCIIAFGGGVIGDLAGFTAGCYLRGIPYLQIPTTLLAQVDSSVGGKVAVNIYGGKNYCGLFHQPKAVYIDSDFIKTLPREEIRNGLAEVVKTAIIRDSKLFAILEENCSGVLKLEQELLLYVLKRCCRIKAGIVQEDEKESGLRQILNFGHTFGHALEEYCQYSLLHGQCVAWGMQKEALLAFALGRIDEQSLVRLLQLLDYLNLVPDVERPEPKSFFQLLLADKKNRADEIIFVLPSSIGEVEIRTEISKEKILKIINTPAKFSFCSRYFSKLYFNRVTSLQ